MRRIFQMALFASLLVLSASFGNTASAQDDPYYDERYEDDEYYDDRRGDVSYQNFYDELSPHGRWIDYPEYGYVWVPNLGTGFRPYSTNGRWVYTANFEWMWVSNYSWGWAPFHYGRWLYDPFYGWIWVPGYEWSPAWVVWRGGGDYWGWAPIRPGIHISIGFSIGSYSPPYDYWCFAPRRYITSPRIYDYCFDRRQNVTIINQTTIINNYNYSRNVFRTGPSRYEAERYAGRITPVRFRESNRPGRTQFRNNEVSVYRPNVQRDNTRRFQPRSFERYDRNAANSNDRVVRNDRRPDRTNGRFERNNDTRTNGNNLPRERTRNNPIDRRSPDTREPRQFERNNDNRGNGNMPGRERTRNNAGERPNRDINQQPRQFERRPEVRNNESPVRQQGPSTRNPNYERPQQSPQSRQFERRGNTERMNQPPVREQRREMSAGSSRPSMERRPQVQQQPQQQPRQFEPRGDNGQRGNGAGNGGGNGRGRGKN